MNGGLERLRKIFYSRISTLDTPILADYLGRNCPTGRKILIKHCIEGTTDGSITGPSVGDEDDREFSTTVTITTY